MTIDELEAAEKADFETRFNAIFDEAKKLAFVQNLRFNPTEDMKSKAGLLFEFVSRVETFKKSQEMAEHYAQNQG